MTGKSEEDVGGGADRRESYGHFKTAADPQNQAVPDHRSQHQPVETLPAQGADRALTDRVHLGAMRMRGGSEYPDPERLNRLI